MPLTSTDALPTLATTASLLASRSGRRKRLLIGLRLILVTLAALLGALTITVTVSGKRLDLAGALALLAFVAVLGIRLIMQGDRDLDLAEPRGRAVAELVTSHAWRYAVGAQPYPLANEGATDTARQRLLESMRRYHEILADFSWSAPAGRQITEQMEQLRSASLDERRDAYLAHRAEPLLSVTSRESRSFAAKYRWLAAAVLIVELVGVPAGALKAIGLSQLDLLGLTAAAAASIALWSDTLNLRERGRGAAAANVTMSGAEDVLLRTEHDWAVRIGRVEEQLCLEAEAVLASMNVPRPQDAGSDAIREMTPDEYFEAARDLKRQIWDQGDRLPKLDPDVIVAVNPGGAILGGMLYFMTRADFLPLSFRSKVEEKDLENLARAYSWQARRGNRLRILVVDASVKSGGNLARGVALVRRVVESKGWVLEPTDLPPEETSMRTYIIRTAVITRQPSVHESGSRVSVDYHYDETTERFPYGNI